MCDLEIDLGQICGEHGETADALAEARPRLEELAADGLIELDGDRITVTPRRPPAGCVVCAPPSTPISRWRKENTQRRCNPSENQSPP